ncbi:hypothetical protein [Limnoglobus roseus]|uniref:Uncharacterized protein n=1 Tax=Limnoglobus roseus TaxID=2598579 RepID=A0A5C1ADY2_9BACT|nr:hypothetical protein [Limnoglobus roseus]QEL16920.1 hypothetical protein PX52LOC_03896 [Limnoglobus roseus]
MTHSLPQWLSDAARNAAEAQSAIQTATVGALLMTWAAEPERLAERVWALARGPAQTASPTLPA